MSLIPRKAWPCAAYQAPSTFGRSLPTPRTEATCKLPLYQVPPVAYGSMTVSCRARLLAGFAVEDPSWCPRMAEPATDTTRTAIRAGWYRRLANGARRRSPQARAAPDGCGPPVRRSQACPHEGTGFQTQSARGYRRLPQLHHE